MSEFISRGLTKYDPLDIAEDQVDGTTNVVIEVIPMETHKKLLEEAKLKKQ